jgi:maleylacetoacetate isomerase
MELYSFFNSSAAYRVRIALALKSLDYVTVPVNIRRHEQAQADYLALNPGGLVPALKDGDLHLGQSLAIIDYLDAAHPDPRLIPVDAVERARVLELSLLVACDIHPLNNLRVLRYLLRDLGLSEDQKTAWYRHWIAEGLRSVEDLLPASGTDGFCLGGRVSLADCCLIPQVANAVRTQCDLSPYPRVMRIYEHCNGLPAFQRARPENQPDYLPPEPAST